MMHYTEIRFFVLFYKLKNTFVTPLHLSSGFQHEIEHALSRRYLAPKNLAPEKCDRLTS